MVLIAMAGLPGAGKSTIADGLSRELRAPVLSVDPIESAMWRAGVQRTEPTGLATYVVAETLARANLSTGISVIVDAVNAVEPARWTWREVAASAGVRLKFVEVVCSDERVHRERVQARSRAIEGFEVTPWEAVLAARAEWAPWSDERLRLDSLDSSADNLKRALDYVRDCA
jgi:predicted kinase